MLAREREEKFHIHFISLKGEKREKNAMKTSKSATEFLVNFPSRKGFNWENCSMHSTVAAVFTSYDSYVAKLT